MRKVALLTAMLIGLAAAGRVQALPRSLNHVDPKAPCFRWPAVDMDGDGVFDRLDRCVNTPKGCIVDEWGCEKDADGDGVCDGVDRCPNTPRGAEVDEHGCSETTAAKTPPPPPPPPAEPPKPPPPPVSKTERELVERGVIRLEKVYFETGSAKLLDESRGTLDEVGEALQKHPELKIEIQGHTDTRGAAAYNRRLSQKRAESARAYLLKHFKLEDRNLVAKGYGESQPETKERNKEQLLRNRRVVLNVLNPDVLPKGVKVEQK